MSETLARRVAAGKFDADVCTWLEKGFAARYLARGDIPLERCLALASTPAKLARAERDVHIFAAWCCDLAPSPWQRSVALKAEVKRFLMDIWPRWREDPAPPAGASELRRHLFLAKTACERAGIRRFPETAEHLHNIVRPFYEENGPTHFVSEVKD